MAQLVEVHLTAFKSFRDATLPIEELTLLVGRNGSGKSNALDGLWTLSRLATGEDLKEAIEGGLEGPPVRGGLEGCTPLGADSFILGCAVDHDGQRLQYEIEIATAPVAQVVHERLWTVRARGPRRGQERDLLVSDQADLDRSDIVVRWDNQKRGLNPPTTMRASRMLITQVPARVPATSEAGRQVHTAADAVVNALSSVLLLDPVPHAMRSYVPARDVELRRNAENLSAAIAALTADEETKARILTLLRELSEPPVPDIAFARSDLGDVMLTIRERIEGQEHTVPARQMSDGTLRFLAVVAAVMQAPRQEATDGRPAEWYRTLVVEELENGLHPSQAARALSVLSDEAQQRRVRLLATTHSTTMLDALPGEAHDQVVVCDRDDSGWSRLTVLSELQRYLDVVTAGGPGDAAVRDELHPDDEESSPDPREALRAMLQGG